MSVPAPNSHRLLSFTETAAVLVVSVLVLAGPLDWRVSKWLDLLLAASVLLAPAAIWSVREFVRPRRLILFLAGWGLITVAGVVEGADAFAEKPGTLANMALGAFSMAGFLLAFEAVLARFDKEATPPLLRAASWLVAGLFVLQYVSCCVSQAPFASWWSFTHRGAAGQALAFVWAVWVLAHGGRSREAWRLLAVSGAFWVLTAMALALWAGLGGADFRSSLAAKGLIQLGEKNTGPFSFYLQFPFQQHNRLGFFLGLIVFASLALLQFERCRLRRRTLYALVALALILLGLNQTRGAILGVLTGMTAFIAATTNWRLSWKVPLLATAIVTVFAVAALPIAGHLAKGLDPGGFKEPESAVRLRAHGYRAGLDMALRNPVIGIGYGTLAFRAHYEENYRSQLGDPENKQHPYNTALEIVSGSGIPAGMLFTALMGLLAAGLWSSRWRRPEAPALLGLLVFFATYGMTNTMIQGPIGYFFWMASVGAAAQTPPPGAQESRA